MTKSLPPSGVVYVNSTSCNVGYSRQQTYTSANFMNNPGCGNVWVSGTYNSDLTIGADNDIIVIDDLKSSSTSIGARRPRREQLRARLPPGHQLERNGTDCDNNGGPGGIQIDAAILALNHSFITDNWYCGNPLGTLTINGALAQKFRGTVGTHSGGTVPERLLEGLQLQRNAALPRAAVLRQPDRDRLARRAPERADPGALAAEEVRGARPRAARGR